MEAKDNKPRTVLYIGGRQTGRTQIALEQAHQLGLQEGRKEVVDVIIEDTRNFEVPLSLGVIAKLKEWGI